MTVLIMIFGSLILLAGIVIIINPEVIFGFLRNNLDKVGLHILAIVVRLILGVLLIYQSNVSKFPFVIEILGWLSIVAAISLSVIGRRNFNRLMSWALSFVKPFGRVGGFLAAAFGAFLIYAFV
ncbi:hypothetical protein [Desulfobacula sp.]|uniref:hypothetical protein n=1 Tax=Desulfobacula sp. TaxID=2593537 RepID=UPI0026046B10|nr:hypothetical protein [Desulfobacula sp.]